MIPYTLCVLIVVKSCENGQPRRKMKIGFEERQNVYSIFNILVYKKVILNNQIMCSLF